MARMTRMTRMAHTVARMARWLADLADLINKLFSPSSIVFTLKEQKKNPGIQKHE